ncbi:MAG: hypothetical protein WA705_30400 [Candidatus Ozemobacteraceae bacterium]
MRRSIIVIPFIIFLFFGAQRAETWDATTHVAITQKAIASLSIPMTTDPELRNILLASSMNPDFSGLGEAYHVWHDPDFVVALQEVASTLKGREKDKLLAVSHGWDSHIQADDVAHTPTGYPNAKKIFGNLSDENYLPSHVSTEFSVALLDYKENPSLYDNLGFYMPPATQFFAAIEVYKKIKVAKGETDKACFQYTPAQYSSDVLKFNAEVTGLRAVFRKIISTKPETAKQLDAKFSDRKTGINGVGGVDQSWEAVTSGLLASDKTSSVASGASAFADRGLYTLKRLGERIGQNVIFSIGDAAISATAGTEKVRSILDNVIKSQSPENAVAAKYVKGLVLESGLSVEDIIRASQADYSPSVATSALFLEAQEQEKVAQKRVDALEEKIKNKGFFQRIWSFLTGNDDEVQCGRAKEELANRKKIVENFKSSKTQPNSIATSGVSTKTSQVEMNKTIDY